MTAGDDAAVGRRLSETDETTADATGGLGTDGRTIAVFARTEGAAADTGGCIIAAAARESSNSDNFLCLSSLIQKHGK